MNVLHLDSSALGTHSASRELTADIVNGLRRDRSDVKVVYRDLDAQPLPHLTGETLGGAHAELAAQVMDEFQQADTIVIGAPMYNFGIPSTLKAWIDRVAVAGKTFRYGANGPEGLAGGKRVIVASTRGGVYGNGPMDFQENYLRAVLGFLGIKDVEFVRAEGLALSPDHRKQAMANARSALALAA